MRLNFHRSDARFFFFIIIIVSILKAYDMLCISICFAKVGADNRITIISRTVGTTATENNKSDDSP